MEAVDIYYRQVAPFVEIQVAAWLIAVAIAPPSTIAAPAMPAPTLAKINIDML